MGQETERKFLVKDFSFKEEAYRSDEIKQGYLSIMPEKSVRVRTKYKKAFLTIKGKTTGFSRAEFEYEIPLDDARKMMELFCETIIDKERYLVKYDNFTWEVDVFHGENEGLVLAEIELNSENTTFAIPEWAGREVTGDQKYYNANLIKQPYRKW
ncbi:MAG TPA: CYTH domain-containing protein [Bacteroidales bacterium]|nr:CYTH domain-containing protein [Bacteroidales bacterium]